MAQLTTKEASESRKQRRDAALTWHVPPELEADFVTSAARAREPSEAEQEAAPPAPATDKDVSQTSCHALMSVYRQAFAQPAAEHLTAIIAQLLQAEGFTVRPSQVTRVRCTAGDHQQMSGHPGVSSQLTVSCVCRALKNGSPASRRWRWKLRMRFRPLRWQRQASRTPASL